MACSANVHLTLKSWIPKGTGWDRPEYVRLAQYCPRDTGTDVNNHKARAATVWWLPGLDR